MRRRIRNGELADFESLTVEDTQALENLLQKLELVALLASRGLVRPDDVLELFPTVPQIVAKVRPHIERRRLTQPSYARHTLAIAAQYP